MRLTFLLLTAGFLNVYAEGLSQNVTFYGKNVSLSTVFASVKNQTGFVFIYTDLVLKSSKPVSVDAKNVPLDEFLSVVFKSQPLQYDVKGKTIFVSARPTPVQPPSGIAADTSMILRGKVLDEDGQPLAGASISIKNTHNLGVSNAQGEFTLKVKEGDVLVISYVEHRSKEVRINAGSTSLFITLSKSNTELDALRVIAYGTESRRLGVGAVNTVTSKDIENQPVINPLAALSGLVPGLNVIFTSGAPGAAVKLQVRGQNSLSQSSFGGKPFDQPLFIVNGVPVAAQNFNINALNSLAGSNFLDVNGGSSPFNGINPSDIESISILRDAAATAIYGTQGANGVILITTKKGKAGKTRLSATVNTAINTAAITPELLNLEQYLSYRKEALANDGIDLATASPLIYPDLLLFDQNKSTDWFNYYMGKTSSNTDAHVSLSGGSDRTTFLTSAGYTRSDYNFPGNFFYKRATFHSNIHHASANNRLSLDFGFDYAYERNASAVSPYVTMGMLTPPNFPDLYDASGKVVWNYKGFNTSAYVQYAANLKQPSVLQTRNMTNSLTLAYRIVHNLKFSLNIGYSRIVGEEAQQKPASSINPNNNPSSTATFATSTFETINIEPQLNYQRSFGRGVVSALVGGTYRKNNTARVQLEGSGYSDESLLGSIGSAATVQATDSYNPYKYTGAFARLGYTHDQKYIIQLAGRRDGSSNFGPGRQFGNFGSIGVGWIFSQEKFFENASRFLSYAKLSGSYGTTGTDATAPYQYQQLFKANSLIPNFQGIRPLFVQNLFNPNYGWDTKKSINAALDLGFLEDRILLNINFYRDRIGNQLVNYTLPSQTGFASVLQNFGATVQNKGLELSLSSRNISGKQFTWSTTINLSFNRNKLVSFPGLEQSSYALNYTVGRSVNTVKGYLLKGVNPQDGIFEYYKRDGSATHNPIYGIPSQGGDYQEIANTDPKFVGGLGNTFTYKGFSLSFLFQFQKRQQANYLKSIYSSAMPGGLFNQPVAILDRWRKPGDNASIQRFTSGYGAAYLPGFYFTTSSGAYSDGSYIRLRTAAFSYTLPASLCQKIGITGSRVFLNGQNLFLITGYKVGDPELANLFSFPIQRTVAMGITINL